MKFTDFCRDIKGFIHVLLPNLGHWEKKLTLALVKQKSVVHISGGLVEFWQETEGAVGVKLTIAAEISVGKSKVSASLINRNKDVTEVPFPENQDDSW